MTDENLLWNNNRIPWSPFQNPSLKTAYSAPQRIQHYDDSSSLQENIIISETVHDGDESSVDQFQENVVTLSNSVIENCMQRPLAETPRRRLSGLQIQTLLCRKRCMIDENFLMNTYYVKSGSCYQIPSAKTVPPSGEKKMTSFIFCKETQISR